MSRRKQAKPRALKREADDEPGDDPDNNITMATDLSNRDTTCPSSQPSETGDEQLSMTSEPALSNTTGPPEPEPDEDNTSGVNEVSLTEEQEGEEGEEEEELEGEEYRCDICNGIFHSLTQFMDHRNFECTPDGESGWRRAVGGSGGSPCSLSRGSSPYSAEGKSPLSLADSPCSPTAAQIPLDQLPFAIGASDGHPYSCQFCEKAFGRLSFLKKHEQVHSDQMPFKCDYCHRLFKHKRSRDRHVKLHTGDRKYRCPHCHSAFSRSDHLKIHLKTHDNAKPFQCVTCNRGYTSAAALTSHTLTHRKAVVNGDADFRCVVCCDKFTSVQDLQVHVLSHDAPVSPVKEKVLQCGQCEEVCLGQDALEFHMEEAHNAVEKRKCPICNSLFSSTEDLLRHLKSHTASDESLASILTKNDHGGHVSSTSRGSGQKRKLSQEEKHDCPYCSKRSFPSIEVLEIHIRTMHADKSGQMHVCQYCNAAYPTLNDLEEHIKIIHHTTLGIKFACEYCTMELADLTSLRAHLEKVHKYADVCGSTGDIVFCSQCTMGFPNAFALSEHVHNIHGVNLSMKNGSNSPGAGPKKEKISRSSSSSSGTSAPNPKCYKETFSSSPLSEKPDPRPSSASGSVLGTLALTNGEASSLTCEQCNATFLDAKSYQVHMASHTDSSESKYTCAECGAEFSSEEQLESHVFIHFLALTTEYGCTSCLKLFSKPDELQKHLMDIHAHHLYRCSLCKEIFDSKVNIQVHFAIKHSNECKLYKCMPCGSVFRSEMEWQLHVKVHHLGMSKPYRCLFCKESFSTEVELQCHLTTHKKQFSCPLCEEAFHVEYLLDKHIQTKHCPGSQSPTKPKQEKDSEILDYSMNSTTASQPQPVTPSKSPQTSSNRQMSPVAVAQSGSPPSTNSQARVSPSPSNHSYHSTPASPPQLKKGDLNHKCDICDVKFSEETALQKHRLHDHSISPEMNLVLQKAQAAALAKQQQAQQQAQVSPKSGHSSTTDKFSQLCVYCNQTFKTKSELEKHMKTHVTPCNQKCNICDEIFPSASILAEHKLTHCKVIKGNVCVVCKVAMKNEEQFYAHAQQHGFHGTNMQCIVCRQTLASMLELQMHGKHHFQNPASFYTCCVCLSSFDSKENLISKLNTSGRTYYVCKPCYHGEMMSEFRCATCNVKFESQGALDAHSVNHKKTYQCIKCQQSFASEYEIQVHVATHVMQEGNVHDCKICGTTFDSPAKLQCHLIEHTFDGTEIRCYICNSLFAHPSAVQMHVLEHGLGARRYACTHCPQSFFFSAELQNHILSAHGTSTSPSPGGATGSASAGGSTNEFQCPECPKVYSSIVGLNSHRKIHEKKSRSTPPSAATSGLDQPLKCSLCPEVYPNVAELQHHFLSSHAADAELLDHKGALSMVALETSTTPVSLSRKNYQCGECGKECTSPNHLQAHSKVHNSGKENRKSHLKVHHGGVKPFPCPICGRAFTRKTHLRDHMKVHLQHVQPSSYACEYCSETFSSTKQLRRHLMVVHHTTPDHGCRICGDTFPHSRHLSAHLQQVHGIVTPPSDTHDNDVSMDTSETVNHHGDPDNDVDDGADVLMSESGPYQNGRDAISLVQDREQLLRPGPEKGAKFDVGVTVVTNPSEQVTVS